MQREHWFGHEKLDVYRLASAVAQWAQGVAIPPSRKHLRDHLTRAADSMALNIAEGAGLPRRENQRQNFRLAAGSAAEVAAILDLLQPPGCEARLGELRRVGAMLAKMARQRGPRRREPRPAPSHSSTRHGPTATGDGNQKKCLQPAPRHGLFASLRLCVMHSFLFSFSFSSSSSSSFGFRFGFGSSSPSPFLSLLVSCLPHLSSSFCSRPLPPPPSVASD